MGIFLRFGLGWRHCRGDGTTADSIELFDPGHAPSSPGARQNTAN